jgi:hypothetical protein
MKLYEWARNMADISTRQKFQPKSLIPHIPILQNKLAVELYYETNHRQ